MSRRVSLSWRGRLRVRSLGPPSLRRWILKEALPLVIHGVGDLRCDRRAQFPTRAGLFICVTVKVPSQAPDLQSSSSPANNQGLLPSYSGGKGLLISCDSDMLVIPECRVTGKTLVVHQRLERRVFMVCLGSSNGCDTQRVIWGLSPRLARCIGTPRCAGAFSLSL